MPNLAGATFSHGHHRGLLVAADRAGAQQAIAHMPHDIVHLRIDMNAAQMYSLRMRRSKRSGRQIHFRREISTRRPMHITQKLVPGLPSMRTQAVERKVASLVVGMQQRGVVVFVRCTLSNHIHLVLRAKSRTALADALRYFFGQLARFVNKAWKRKGRVFAERYFSRQARNALQIWNTLAYVLRNAKDAGIRLAPHLIVDPYTYADREAIGTDSFLSRIFGQPSDTPHWASLSSAARRTR